MADRSIGDEIHQPDICEEGHFETVFLTYDVILDMLDIPDLMR